MPLPLQYLVALVTPFTQRGALDVKAHAHNLRVLAAAGITGFVIGGSNGEGPYLEPGERATLIKAGRRRKAHFMAGVAAESTRSAINLLTEVRDAGADSALVMTPTTVARNREDAVTRFYLSVADKSHIPVYLYSVPSVTSYDLPVGLIARLARHERIVGIKDSSGDVVRLQTIVESTPGDFAVYSGSSRSITAAMAVGCRGVITGSGNYAPRMVLNLLESIGTDPERTRRLQKRLSILSGEIEQHGVPGVKAAAKAAGLDPGHPREPLIRLGRGAETSIAKLVPNT